MDDQEKSDGQSRVGTTIAGKYHLDRLLGKGGMGAVYQATHTGIDRKFALKLMHDHPAADSEARFEREARAAGRIGHPNIVDVFDFGRTERGDPYIVMELCSGESLAERIVRGPLRQHAAAEIAVEILRALEAAHGAGIVHRDVKPANVFVNEDADGKRCVKVLDFGI
ncbi:MAG: serine/threonine-protein kinase, partial [Polyangiaceae bacterium]